MATYYFNGDAFSGSPAGDGTEGDPYTSLASFDQTFATALANGDIVNLAGTFTVENGAPLGILAGGTHVSLGVKSVTIQQWSGQPQCRIAPVQKASNLSWTGTGGGPYTATITPTNWGGANGARIDGVWWDYFNNVDSLGRHFGALKYVSGGATAAGEWSISGSTITIYTPSGTDADAPGTDEYYIVEQTTAIVEFSNISNVTFSGIKVYMGHGDRAFTGSVLGGGFLNASTSPVATNTVFKHCYAYDCAWHAFELSGPTGNKTGSRFIDCHSWGFNRISVGYTAFVIYSGNSGGVNNCLYDRCTHHHYASLKYDGTPLYDAATPAGEGFYSHGDSAGDVTGITFRDCVVYGYDNAVCNAPFLAASLTAGPPADIEDPASYEAHFIRCRAYNCGRYNPPGKGFYDECYLDLGRTASASGFTMSSTSSGSDVFYRNTIIVSSADDFASGGSGIFNLGAQVHNLVFHNCLLFIQGAATSSSTFTAFFQIGAAGTKVVARNNIFATGSYTTGTRRLFTFDNSIATGDLTFEGNMYAQISANRYSDLAGRQSEANWISLVEDVYALHSATALDFQNPSRTADEGVWQEADFTCLPTGDIRQNPVPSSITARVTRGRNGLPHDYTAGPNQYGGGGNRNSRIRTRNR